MSIVTEWQIKTVSARNRSAELQAVDTAVSQYALHGAGAKNANLAGLWNAFSAWKTARPLEYNTIQVPANELHAEVYAKWNGPVQLAGVKSTGTKPEGWKLVYYDQTIHGAVGPLVPTAERVGPLTTSQITKVNESIRRVSTAIEAARDGILTVLRRKNFTPPMPPEEQAYVDFFGAYDQARLSRVVKNLQVLALAFKNKPEFVDVRNRTIWRDTYGGCIRRDLAVKSAKGVLSVGDNPGSLSGSITMLIGRSFLGTGPYAQTTDATIGTLVHEFSHGSFAAVDVPEVDNTGTFGCTRDSDNQADADFGNSTDPHHHQSSTEADDKRLAEFHPDYAIVNADNYGQFARVMLMAKSG